VTTGPTRPSVDASVPALGIGDGLALDDLARRVRLPI
jgi:hypothetical protein